MSDTALVKRSNTIPIGIRAKRAIDAYVSTGSGIAALQEFVFPNSIDSFGYSSGGGFLSVSPRNFPYQNVNAYNSSIVMACLNWIVRAFREGIPSVIRHLDNGTEENIANHRLVKLLRKPNPYYSFSKLMSATLISYYLDGNGYWFKERSDGGNGFTRALYYIPHYQIKPKAEAGSYITHYEYTTNGKTYRIPRERIIHFRFELDPYNPLSGRKILAPVLSEIYTDEEAAMFIAALLRNSAIPGIVIMPDTEKVKVEEEDAAMLKENFKRKFGGDNRGEPLITNFAAKIFQMGFNPEQLQFRETRRLPEERVASQFSLPPIVAGLGAGLDRSTFANYEQAESQAYRSCIIPAWLEIAEEIDGQLLPEFIQTNAKGEYAFHFDYSEVRALQESQNDLTNRTTRLFSLNIITRAEARAETGFEVEESRDNLFNSELGSKPGKPQDSPVKALHKAALMLKAGEPEDNLNSGFEIYQETDIKAASQGMEEELNALFEALGKQAEKEARENLDINSPIAEAERISQDVIKALGIGLLLRAIFGKMSKTVEEGVATSIVLRLGITEGDFWGVDLESESKGLLLSRIVSYESALSEQTKQAIQIAIQGAESGLSVAQIGKRIKSYVAGAKMYPGIFEEAYNAAKEAGASEEEARRAGESKARRYRAKMVAETESRSFQNLATLTGFEKAGIDKVKVTDGDGCGWKTHNDTDKAHNTVRLASSAKKYALAHPLCKRRFYPITE